MVKFLQAHSWATMAQRKNTTSFTTNSFASLQFTDIYGTSFKGQFFSVVILSLTPTRHDQPWPAMTADSPRWGWSAFHPILCLRIYRTLRWCWSFACPRYLQASQGADGADGAGGLGDSDFGMAERSWWPMVTHAHHCSPDGFPHCRWKWAPRDVQYFKLQTWQVASTHIYSHLLTISRNI